MGSQVAAQGVNLSSPRDAVKTHMENLQPDNYHPGKAAKAFYTDDSAKAVSSAIKLKQILDAKGLYIYYSQVPARRNYRDTLTGSNTYVIFNDYPQIYLKKYGDKWYYAHSTVEAIPGIHRAVFPAGTSYILNLIPDSGRSQILGIALWQYAGLGILLALGFGLYKISRWLLYRLIHRLLKQLLGYRDADRYELAISRLLSSLMVMFMVNLTLPALQLPVNFSYYFFWFSEY